MLIKIEAFAGESIESCFDEATNVARILNMTAEFEFNGITCMCSPFGNKESFVANYHRVIKSNNKYKIATS